MALENDDSKLAGKRPRNVGVSFSEGVEAMKDADIAGGEWVDLTFMVVSNEVLDDMQKRQR